MDKTSENDNVWWNKSKICSLLVDELIQIGALKTKETVQNFQFVIPEYVGADIAVWTGIALDDQIYTGHTTASLIQSVQTSNHVCNIKINYKTLLKVMYDQFRSRPDRFGMPVNEKGRHYIIEHTSLNTLYPVNVATFRSTVIGHAAKCFLSKCGHQVQSSFWVESFSRQYQVILTALKVLETDAAQIQSLSGKPDHELGYIYASTLLSYKNSSLNSEEVLSKMFPKAVGRLLIKNCQAIENFDMYDIEEQRNNLRILRNYCLGGYRKTFDRCDISIDRYDIESDSRYSNYAYKHRPDYALRNVYYYLGVLDDTNSIISIVPYMMISQPTPSTSLVARVKEYLLTEYGICPERTQFFPYGPVCIIQGDGSCEDDKIASGRYTSVDTFIEYNMGKNGFLEKDVTNALKLLLLAAERNVHQMGLHLDLAENMRFINFLRVFHKSLDVIRSVGSDKFSDIDSSRLINNILLKTVYLEVCMTKQINEIPEFGGLVRAVLSTHDIFCDILNRLQQGRNMSEDLTNSITMLNVIIMNVLSSLGIDLVMQEQHFST